MDFLSSIIKITTKPFTSTDTLFLLFLAATYFDKAHKRQRKKIKIPNQGNFFTRRLYVDLPSIIWSFIICGIFTMVSYQIWSLFRIDSVSFQEFIYLFWSGIYMIVLGFGTIGFYHGDYYTRNNDTN